MLDCNECDLAAMTNRQHISKFVNTMVTSIGMVAVGNPWIEQTAIDDPCKAGFSLYQLIVTSNISAHFVDLHRQIYLDIFSCREFDQKIAKKIVEVYFNPKKIKSTFITRNAD
jgi:S-adenosylmethionine/arginine decarboxylase-like enzyme